MKKSRISTIAVCGILLLGFLIVLVFTVQSIGKPATQAEEVVPNSTASKTSQNLHPSEAVGVWQEEPASVPAKITSQIPQQELDKYWMRLTLNKDGTGTFRTATIKGSHVETTTVNIEWSGSAEGILFHSPINRSTVSSAMSSLSKGSLLATFNSDKSRLDLSVGDSDIPFKRVSP